ncbi:MAG: hypothetical protein ACOY9Y_02650 [Bacillota bacterium]
MVISAFVLSGLLAGVAGLLAAGRQGSVSNSVGEGMVAMLAFAGAILGGASLDGGKGTPLGMLGGYSPFRHDFQFFEFTWSWCYPCVRYSGSIDFRHH